jgi:(1->4)-alpha-D-glucan 1-alpha-D-glucosylmutase
LAQADPSPELARELLAHKADGRIKLYLTSRALAYRAAHSDLFARGEYVPLSLEGSGADHVVAFARRHGDEKIIVAVPRQVAGLTGTSLVDPIGPTIWGETRLVLGDGLEATRYRDDFTGKDLSTGVSNGAAGLALGEVFSVLPFALLERVA